MSNDIYTSPLTGRYSSLQMQKLFSLGTRFSTWDPLALARRVPEGAWVGHLRRGYRPNASEPYSAG
jgi:hypothetical protein